MIRTLINAARCITCRLGLSLCLRLTAPLCDEGYANRPGCRIKNTILSLFLRLAPDAQVSSKLRVLLPERRNITVGPRSFIGQGVVLANFDSITIDADSYLANDVAVLTGTHQTTDFRHAAAPVRIGSGCWIGARAVILPGITVADGTVLGANSTLTRSTTPFGVYTGTPARRIKDRNPLCPWFNVWGEVVGGCQVPEVSCELPVAGG
jgi:maltose O-acetyltransferase